MVDKPAFRLWYKGVDIAEEIAPHVLEATYTDKLDGGSDEIEIKVQDKDGLWRGPWCPDHGDVVRLEIARDRDGGAYVPCGTFELDEPCGSIRRSGDTFSMRGVAAAVSKALRTKKTRAFENQSLKHIAQRVASEHGLTIVGTPPDVTFSRVTQRRKRDLAFLTKMANDYGAYFSVRGNQMIFMNRDEVHNRKPVRIIDVDHPEFISAEVKKSAHKTYSKAKGSYYDGREKKTIDASVEDKAVKTGDTLRLDNRAETDSQAKTRAKSALDRKNLKKQTVSLTMLGDPMICSGQTLQLGPGFGKWAGKYVVQETRHPFARSGYEMTMELAYVG